VVIFHQGVRDEKMLEKLATHDIKDVVELFSLSVKCAKAMEGQAWHTPPAPEAGKGGQPNAGAAAQRSGCKSKNENNKKNKVGGNNQPLTGASTAMAPIAAGGGRGPQGDKHPRQTSNSDDGGACCLMHSSARHTIGDCQEIKKLTK
jgi:hypothetical protein